MNSFRVSKKSYGSKRANLYPAISFRSRMMMLCVNIGYKSDGIIHKNELAMAEIDPKKVFNIGDEIEAEVVSLNDGEGNVLLSRKTH